MMARSIEGHGERQLIQRGNWTVSETFTSLVAFVLFIFLFYSSSGLEHVGSSSAKTTWFRKSGCQTFCRKQETKRIPCREGRPDPARPVILACRGSNQSLLSPKSQSGKQLFFFFFAFKCSLFSRVSRTGFRWKCHSGRNVLPQFLFPSTLKTISRQ